MNLYSCAHEKVQKMYLKSWQKKQGRKEKTGKRNKNILFHIKDHQLISAGIINYPEALNKVVVCHSLLKQQIQISPLYLLFGMKYQNEERYSLL